ncbi:MAG: hypothetical protein AB7J40_01190 [Candidatus Altimarinota bacterium]
MSQKKYPKKGFGSYLLPFTLIIVLVASGWYIVQNKVNLSDLQRLLQPPPVAKDEKVTIVYQEGDNELKPWSDEKWGLLRDTDFLQAGDTIKTSPTGLLVLRFFEGSEIRLDKKTEIKLIRLDKNVTEGDHISIELISGQLWRRGMDGNTQEADFIINTSRQIIQMNKASVIDLSTNPDRLRVIGGQVVSNVAERMNGTRKPIGQLELSGGQQVTLDDLNLDLLKAGEKNIVSILDESYRSSEWYLWNLEKEEQLGLVTEIVEVAELPAVELESLEEGLVVVTTPTANQKVGARVSVTGTYDKDQIESIWVNDQKATLGLTDQWEAVTTLSEQKNSIQVTAQEKGSEKKKEVVKLDLKVDTQGPILGNITKPEVDENGNGVISGDTIELIGEIDTDAEKVCISHNDSTPAYCLKQFVAGAKTYRYLGGVGYGNLVSGKNKYSIFAYDALGNTSQKTVYIFKDQEKPTTRLIEDTPSTPPTTTAVELSKPVITSPDPSTVLQTSEQSLTITGTVDPKSQSLFINDKKATFTAGSTSFEVTISLQEGENLLKVQSSDAQGNRSKTATLTVIYLKESASEEASVE